MVFLRRIVGDSMKPTLHHGQFVVVRHARHFEPGQVVVAFMNGREVIKRIQKIEHHNVYLVGDNVSESSDSRKYGAVSDIDIFGIVWWPKTAL